MYLCRQIVYDKNDDNLPRFPEGQEAVVLERVMAATSHVIDVSTVWRHFPGSGKREKEEEEEERDYIVDAAWKNRDFQGFLTKFISVRVVPQWGCTWYFSVAGINVSRPGKSGR